MTTTEQANPRLIRLVQGDTNDTRLVQLDGVVSIPPGASLEAHVWRDTVPATSATLPVTLVDSAARSVRISFGTWINTAVRGSWRWEVQVTGNWSDGSTGPKTFPTEDGNPLEVRAAGG